MNAEHGRHRIIRYVPGAAVLLAGLGIAGTLIATTPKAPQAEAEERAHAVSVQEVQPGRHAPAVGVYGKVEAATVTELEAALTAPVKAVEVREGDRVEAGTVLVRLDASQARLELRARQAETREARAVLASLEADAAHAAALLGEQEELAELAAARLERIEALHARHMVARAHVDDVREEATRARMALARYRAKLADYPNRIERQQAAVARAEVAEERARIDLERTRVRAPFSGPVLAVHVARGDQVLPGTPLVRLADASSIEIRATLPAEHAGRLRQELTSGHPVHAMARLDDTRIATQLQRLASDRKHGRVGIDAFFTLPAGPGLELGRVVDLRVSLPPEHDLVALPVQAIYVNNRIYRVENERLVAMNVEVVGEAETGNGYRLLVRSPELRSGQRIITTQLPQAMSGLRVAPVTDRVASREVREAPSGSSG